MGEKGMQNPKQLIIITDEEAGIREEGVGKVGESSLPPPLTVPNQGSEVGR